MNWSEYSRFVGDIFGAPLAIEALLAFFLESTFLGLWIFGWDKLPKLAHLAAIWLVAIGANVSAFWILVANSFMQQPVGYALRNGRAEMDDFWALVTNPHVCVQFPHVIARRDGDGRRSSCSASAPGTCCRAKDEPTPRRVPAARSGSARSYALVAAIAVMRRGARAGAVHGAGAADEDGRRRGALGDRRPGADVAVHLGRRAGAARPLFASRCPALLSFLAYNRFEGEVQGIKDLQAEYEAQLRPRQLRAAGDVDLLELPRDGRRRHADAACSALGAGRGASRSTLRAAAGSCWRCCAGDRAALRRPTRTGWIFTEIGRAALDRVRR